MEIWSEGWGDGDNTLNLRSCNAINDDTMNMLQWRISQSYNFGYRVKHTMKIVLTVDFGD